jgi:hypothetical protein
VIIGMLRLLGSPAADVWPLGAQLCAQFGPFAVPAAPLVARVGSDAPLLPLVQQLVCMAPTARLDARAAKHHAVFAATNERAPPADE